MPSGSPPFIYGYILKENVKKAFMKERNMKYFVIKEKRLKKEDVRKVMDSFKMKQIDFAEFRTADENSISGISKVKIVTTEQEAVHIYTAEDQVFNYLGKMTEPCMLDAKGKYKEALSGLCYYSIYHWYGKYDKFYDVDEWRDIDPDSLFMDKKVKLDELEAYFHFHGKTLKITKEAE